MSYVKFDFLNWKPDINDYDNDGLKQMAGALHSPSGYSSFLYTTAGAFSTQAAYSGGPTAIASLYADTFGNNNEEVIAFVTNATAPAFGIAIPSAALMTSITLATMTSASSAALDFFSIAELNQDVVVSAQCSGSLAAGGSTTYNIGGTITYSLISI